MTTGRVTGADDSTSPWPAPDVDAIVVGAGIGGVYAVHKLRQLGVSVVGLEGSGGVGGVWYHNRYPGARTDLEALWYSWHVPDIQRAWRWSERYPAQPELLAYIEFAADLWGVRDHFRFDTWVRSASWDDDARTWTVHVDGGAALTCRWLVLSTGALSHAREPAIAGVDDFDGLLLRTAHWPHRPPALAGKRIGIVGTASTGVQAVTHLAEVAAHLYVLQRTPHYSAPAQNHPLDDDLMAAHAARADTMWAEVKASRSGTAIPPPPGPAKEFGDEERRALLDARWAFGGHAMTSVFSDQGVDVDVSELVAEFVREKIKAKVHTAALCQRVLPGAYPLGVRRLAVDTGYYEALGRDNVTLVSLWENPIERIVPGGVQLHDGRLDLDVLVLATGFDAITGAFDAIDITGVGGTTLRQHWRRGPMAHLGLMTSGFPNLFLETGPGSTAGMSNLFPCSQHHGEVIADMVGYMVDHDLTRVEPSAEAEDWWRQEVAVAATGILRNRFDNQLIYVDPDDQRRTFMSYAGGFGRYVQIWEETADAGYKGFDLR
jgi:cyclohexanone monooxygenase